MTPSWIFFTISTCVSKYLKELFFIWYEAPYIFVKPNNIIRINYFFLPVFDGKGLITVFPSALPSFVAAVVRQSLWCPDRGDGSGGGNGGGGGACIEPRATSYDVSQSSDIEGIFDSGENRRDISS